MGTYGGLWGLVGACGGLWGLMGAYEGLWALLRFWLSWGVGAQGFAASCFAESKTVVISRTLQKRLCPQAHPSSQAAAANVKPCTLNPVPETLNPKP